MTKKKRFHGINSSKRQAAGYVFFHKHYAGSANFHAFGNLQQKGLPGAANTEQAKGGNQGLPDTDSTSTIHENGGNVK